jgi:hypothetical protein
MSAMIVGCAVSAGPAPMPLRLDNVLVLPMHSLKSKYLHACSHETVIGIGSGSPNRTTEANERRCNQYRPLGNGEVSNCSINEVLGELRLEL